VAVFKSHVVYETVSLVTNILKLVLFDNKRRQSDITARGVVLIDLNFGTGLNARWNEPFNEDRARSDSAVWRCTDKVHIVSYIGCPSRKDDLDFVSWIDLLE